MPPDVALSAILEFVQNVFQPPQDKTTPGTKTTMLILLLNYSFDYRRRRRREGQGKNRLIDLLASPQVRMREREKSAGKSRENETGWEQNAVKVSLAVWSREIFWIWREERLNVAITKSRHVKRAGASNIISWRSPFIQEKKRYPLKTDVTFGYVRDYAYVPACDFWFWTLYIVSVLLTTLITL